MLITLRTLFIALLLGFTSTTVAHTYHATLTDMVVNQQTGQLEVIHRFFADDVAKVLSAESKQTIRFDDALTSEQVSLIRSYVENHFKLYDGNNNEKALLWVGTELDTHYLFIYQEVAAPTSFAGYQLQNSLLFGHLHQQVNTVNIRLSEALSSLVFTPDTVRLPLQN
ncbi:MULTISPECIES: DUF6702 family protein [Corallincola]|uniref:Orphan protein n=2 Tax=Corallincola TaxID=1775176 RepID=A0ABY1WLI6_9GAMM|nr:MULTISPECIES: DUF6702 family protein [Corallincola]TAA41765.1 hypothetical protein EXY25_16120 [Corallincola spongiicola]TCI02244.1 hypothetical protein EZV61_15040 [Corallincola luteus]